MAIESAEKEREKESKNIPKSEFLMRQDWGRTDLEQKTSISTRRRTNVRREGESDVSKQI